jgi:hypothetical protein
MAGDGRGRTDCACPAQSRAGHVEIAAPLAHASVHLIIENQIAEAGDRVVMAAPPRRRPDRRQATHAMSSALGDTIFLADKRPDAPFDILARYNCGLERPRPKDWRGAT